MEKTKDKRMLVGWRNRSTEWKTGHSISINFCNGLLAHFSTNKFVNKKKNSTCNMIEFNELLWCQEIVWCTKQPSMTKVMVEIWFKVGHRKDIQFIYVICIALLFHFKVEQSNSFIWFVGASTATVDLNDRVLIKLFVK